MSEYFDHIRVTLHMRPDDIAKIDRIRNAYLARTGRVVTRSRLVRELVDAVVEKEWEDRLRKIIGERD